MTENELLDDLDRLLRDGLVVVELSDEDDVDARPRFALTAHGRARSSGERLYDKRESA